MRIGVWACVCRYVPPGFVLFPVPALDLPTAALAVTTENVTILHGLLQLRDTSSQGGGGIANIRCTTQPHTFHIWRC